MTVALEPVELDSATRLVFYRVAQEALSNVTRHANATDVSVTLSKGELIELTITDNGRGFDPTLVPAGHFGLTIMGERARSVGAQLDVVSEPGRGTQLRIFVLSA
jgi:signal transduction histidine kinase